MQNSTRLANLKQDLASISQHLVRALDVLAKICRDNELLIVAYAVCLATIVLSNNEYLPRYVYFYCVLPIGILVGVGFALRVIKTSIVFWAVAAYLLAMGLAALAAADVPVPEIKRHFRLIPAILAYLIIIALLASDRTILKRLMLACCLVLAISAAINVAGYLLKWQLPAPFTSNYGRFVAALGMPNYFNSTNISAPYAIYCLGALAALTRSDLKNLERALFATSALVLAVAFIMTEARSAYLAAIAGYVVVAASFPKQKRLMLYGVSMVIILALAASATVLTVQTTRGMSYRPELWSAFLFHALERPFTGHGIRGYLIPMADGYRVDQPHNLVLSAFVRGGVVGAIAMATAIGAALYWAARHWLKTREAIPLTLIVAMTTVGMLDYQLLATYPTWPWVTFWFPLGVCVGIETTMQRPQPASACRRQCQLTMPAISYDAIAMATLLIRNLDDQVAERLRLQARLKGVSVEEEARRLPQGTRLTREEFAAFAASLRARQRLNRTRAVDLIREVRAR